MNKIIIILLLTFVLLSSSQCSNNAANAPTNNPTNNGSATDQATTNSPNSPNSATNNSASDDHSDHDHQDKDNADEAPDDDSPGASTSDLKPTAEAMAAATANIEKLRRQYPTPQVGKLIKLPSGLQYVDLKAGFGIMPQLDKYIAVHYTGKLENGPVFETTRNREPFLFRFKPGRVIKGWEEGLATLKVGGIRKLIVPPALAYGQQGTKIIPPNATLIFEIELLEAETDEEEE